MTTIKPQKMWNLRFNGNFPPDIRHLFSSGNRKLQ